MRLFGLKIGKARQAERQVVSFPTQTYRPDTAPWTEWNITEYYKAYTRNPYFFRVANYIAMSAASVDTYITDANGDEVETSDAKTLWEHPNPLMGTRQFVQHLFLHYILGGQAFGLSQDPSGQGMKPPRELYPMGANLMSIRIPATLGQVSGFVYKPKNVEIPLTLSEVFWFSSPNPANLYDAVPATAAAGKSIDANDAYLTYIRDLNVSGGTGHQKFTPKEGVVITPTMKDMLKGQWYEKTGSSLVVAPANGTFEPLGFSPKDMDTAVMADKLVRDICIAFGVSPILLGQEATFANYESARAQFYLETILPLLDIFYPALSLWLTARFGEEVNVVYDIDRISALNILRRAKWSAVKEGYQGGLVTLDEARYEIGYPEVEDGSGKEFYSAPSLSSPFATVEDEGKSWVINTTKRHKCGC